MRLKYSAILFLALTTAQPAAAQFRPNANCYEVVVAMREAGDCQSSEAYHQLYWPGASAQLPDGSISLYENARLLGPCPKYRTYLREFEIGPVANNRQSVRFKSISTRVAVDGRYSGDYTVSEQEVTCEERGGEWRILSSIGFYRNDFVNEDAAEAFRRSGGYDNDPETEY